MTTRGPAAAPPTALSALDLDLEPEIDRRQHVILGAAVAWCSLGLIEFSVPALYDSAWWPAGPPVLLALACVAARHLIATGWEPPVLPKPRPGWRRRWRWAWTTAPLLTVTIGLSYAAWMLLKEAHVSSEVANLVSTPTLWSMRPKKVRAHARRLARSGACSSLVRRG